jgi:ribonuclease HII
MTKNMKQEENLPIVGIDEVGRGPLAGPVTVAAVFLAKNHKFLGLKDSKQLTPASREKWYGKIRKNRDIFYALASVSPKSIDRANVTKCANLAAGRAFKKLIKSRNLRPDDVRVFLDGGLYLDLPKVFKPAFAKTVIKGDEKIDAVKLASVVAKVRRDRYMKLLHKSYPKYGFEEHKGYGTKKHLNAIVKYGPSDVHRLTFLRKYLTISS